MYIKTREDYDFLDMLVIISFIAQLQNMSDDEKETAYIHKVIKALANDIERIHLENRETNKKLDEIITILRSNNYGNN